MSSLLALQFQVDPAMERNPEDGYVLLLELDGESSDESARCWVARGHFMERPEAQVLRWRQPSYIPRAAAVAIFRSLSLASVRPLSVATLGFHTTRYQLTDLSLGCSAEFVWWHELPEGWQLETTVSQLKALAATVGESEA